MAGSLWLLINGMDTSSSELKRKRGLLLLAEVGTKLSGETQ